MQTTSKICLFRETTGEKQNWQGAHESQRWPGVQRIGPQMVWTGEEGSRHTSMENKHMLSLWVWGWPCLGTDLKSHGSGGQAFDPACFLTWPRVHSKEYS